MKEQETRFNSEAEAIEWLKKQGLKSRKFFINVYGWDTYLTLHPTFATPTGKLKEFPRTKTIKIN